MRGRSAFASAVAALALHASCTRPPPTEIPGPQIEVQLDEGRSSERPLTPSPTFEVLMRIDPHLSVFHPIALRFLLAQPGHVVFRLYATDDVGHPGPMLLELDRLYGPEMTSSGSDGKWVVERIEGVPPQHAPVFVGISSPEKQSDPRLWASSNDTGSVFQREADPAVTLDQTRIPRTPKLRVTVVPE